MSAPEDDVSVDVDGVSVRKTVNDHQFETLAIVFDIRSGRDAPADVSVTDVIPGEVVQDDIGFHPEYGGEHWRAGAGAVTFTRTFEPGELYTTVYGIRDFDRERTELLTEPTVEVDAGTEGDGVEDIDELVSEDDGDLVRDLITGERDLLPGLDEEPAEEAPSTASPGEGEAADAAGAEASAGGAGGPDVEDEPGGAMAESTDVEGEASPTTAETTDAEGEPGGFVAGEPGAESDVPAPAEPGDEEEEPSQKVGGVGDESPARPAQGAPEGPGGEPTDTESDVAAADEAPGDEVTVPVTGGIARVLAKELRAGNVSPEDRRLLREELLPDEGSVDARIGHLQQEVADLEAYTDAIEAFLDEEGGAEAVLGELEDELDDLADDVRDVSDDLSGLEGSLDEVDSTVGGLASDAGRLEDEVAAVSDDVTGVSERVDGLAADVADVEDEFNRLDPLAGRLERVEDDVAGIQDELSDFAAFRDRLSSVFGPGGGMGGTEGDEDPDGNGGNEGYGRYGD